MTRLIAIILLLLVVRQGCKYQPYIRPVYYFYQSFIPGPLPPLPPIPCGIYQPGWDV